MLWTINGGTRLIPFLGTWNATGQPAVSIPMGFTDDAEKLPLAVQLVGRPDDEATLISLAGRSRPSAPGSSTARPGSRERRSRSEPDQAPWPSPRGRTISAGDSGEELLEVAVERPHGGGLLPERVLHGEEREVRARAPPRTW